MPRDLSTERWCPPPGAITDACGYGPRLWPGRRRESNLQRHRDRDVVGGPLPPAGIAQDAEIADLIFQRPRDPDVVEPAAAIAHGPVGGAIAPPGIDLLGQRNPLARDVEPFALRLR